MFGDGASAGSDISDFHLTQRSAPSVQSRVAADVAAAFECAHGRESSPAAALGYDAGRLLDAAVAGSDAGIEDLDSVVAAASEVNDELVSSEVSAPEPATADHGPRFSMRSMALRVSQWAVPRTLRHEPRSPAA